MERTLYFKSLSVMNSWQKNDLPFKLIICTKQANPLKVIAKVKVKVKAGMFG
jgi:hypothetical protein